MGTLFSVSIGSAGEGGESYAVHLPFSLPNDWNLTPSEAAGGIDLDGHLARINRYPGYYALSVRGFRSEPEAQAFAEKSWAALYWVALSNRRGVQFPDRLIPITAHPTPLPVVDRAFFAPLVREKGWGGIDASFDTDKPSVLPDHKRIVAFTPGAARVVVSTPENTFVAAVSEALRAGQPELVMRNPKLRLALEVYLSSHFESTPGARFLARIMTLEVLIPETPVSRNVQALVDRFTEECRAAMIAETDQATFLEFESMASALSRLRTRSIKSRIRHLVRDSLISDLGAGDAAATAREVSALYDLRSKLVHEGLRDEDRIREASNRLDDVVPMILRSHFLRVAAAQGASSEET